MQPIVMLGIIAVAGTAMSVGFLGNTIDLSMVQSLGVGETDLESSVDKASVDFVIGRDTGLVGGDVITRNVITDCIVQNTIPGNGPTAFEDGSNVICKLTDEFNNVVAEGQATPANGASTVTVPITDLSFPLSNDVTNIHDLIIVVQGPSQLVPQP